MNQNCINSGTCHKVYFTVNQYCSWPSGQQNGCILKMIWHLDFICSLEMMIWMMWLSILNWKTTSVFRVTKQVSIYWCSDEMKKIHASMWLMILMRYKLITNIEHIKVQVFCFLGLILLFGMPHVLQRFLRKEMKFTFSIPKRPTTFVSMI